MSLGTLGPQECPLCWHFDCQCWLEGGLGSIPTASPNPLEDAILGTLARRFPQPRSDMRFIAKEIAAHVDTIPREPTQPMVRAGQCAVSGFPHAAAIEAVWKAMWDASGMEARKGGDGETRLHRNDDSPARDSGDAKKEVPPCP
jgi:hypothetical protein